MPSCDCYDWQRFHLPCKHFCAVFHLYPDHGWDMLPASYKDNPFFRLHETVVGTSLETQEPAAADPADDDCDATPLSLAESQCLRSAKAAACREVLCALTNSTYLVGDTPTLESLYNKLLDLHAELIPFIPSESGIHVNPLHERSSQRRRGGKKRRCQLLVSGHVSASTDTKIPVCRRKKGGFLS